MNEILKKTRGLLASQNQLSFKGEKREKLKAGKAGNLKSKTGGQNVAGFNGGLCSVTTGIFGFSAGVPGSRVPRLFARPAFQLPLIAVIK